MKTDNELRRDVETELQWDPSVDARDIGVSGKNGVVTLTGQVSNYSEKWRAERIAKRVAGVVALANDIEVKLSTERTDTDIAQAAALALASMAYQGSALSKLRGRKMAYKEPHFQLAEVELKDPCTGEESA